MQTDLLSLIDYAFKMDRKSRKIEIGVWVVLKTNKEKQDFRKFLI